MACILMFMLSLGLFFVGSSWRSCCIRKIPGETGCSKLPSTEVFVFRAEDSWLCLESSTSFVVNFLAKQTPFVLCCFLFAPPHTSFFLDSSGCIGKASSKANSLENFCSHHPSELHVRLNSAFELQAAMNSWRKQGHWDGRAGKFQPSIAVLGIGLILFASIRTISC